MMTLSEAAAAIGANLQGNDVRFRGVTTDSRMIAAGELFVALPGERFNGHDFVARARSSGAVAAMVTRAEVEKRGKEWSDFPLLLVEDTRLGLGALAGCWRSRFINVPLAAITGSNGKTTVKEMLASILREAVGEEAVLATQGNLNNDIGMPLTLLGLREQHRYAVLEMGMNHPGEIAYLSRIAMPDAALINNAQAAHLAGLGSVAEVARAKGEIFEGLKPEGIALINADDPYAPLWRQLAGNRRVLDFGLELAAQVSASYELRVMESALEISTPRGGFSVSLKVPGMHNVRNALAAAAAAVALGVESGAIAAGLSGFSGVKGRLQRKAGINGSILIDDTYNANPESVRAAIAVLSAAPGRKILVLGDMGELGGDAELLHAQIGDYARQAGVDRLFALGDLGRHAVMRFGKGAMHFERIQELLAEVENQLAPGVTVLVKGSRFMQMERIIKSFELQQAATKAAAAGS